MNTALTCNMTHVVAPQLPSADMLDSDVNLSACAARALDLIDPGRVPVLMQADDPVFLCSSKGAYNEVLVLVLKSPSVQSL